MGLITNFMSDKKYLMEEENQKKTGVLKSLFLKSSWRILVLSALMGFGAGLLAVLTVFIFMSASLLQIQQKGGTADDLGKKINISTQEVTKHGSDASDLALKIISLCRDDNSKVTQLAPNNILSSAIPLTSDGWVVALKPAGVLGKLGVAWNRLFYASEKIIHDPLTGLIFLKVKIQSLPLVPFGKINNLIAGNELIAYDNQKTFYATRLLNSHLEISSSTIRSSESLDAFMRIQAVPAGVPIFNSKGEFVGVAKNNDLMISSNYIQTALKDILKDGKIHRPFLGVNYLDLSTTISTVNLEDKHLLGALIKSDKDNLAVLKDSPAYRAGLKEGDIILAVDNFEINENQTLAEVVAGFSPGTKVTLNILQDGQEKKIEVTLGSK